MLFLCVFCEILSLLLDGLSAHVADVTIVLLIIFKLVSSLSQTGESIKHEPTYDITKKHIKESNINNVIQKTHNLERLHRLSNCTWHIELSHTVHYTITHILDSIITGIYIFHVVTESYCAENNCEENTHYTYENETLGVVDCWVENGA